MKELFLKALPLVAGGALGYLLFAAPDWFSDLGPLRYPFVALLLLVALVSFLTMLILANLPADVRLDPAPGEGPELRALFDQYTELGFAQAGPVLKVGFSPPALLVPLVHEGERIYGTVFKTGTVPAKVSYDMVSILDGDRGGLTTGPDPAGAVLPAAPGSLQQVFPGAPVGTLFDEHRRALVWLREQGFGARPLSAATFADDFRRAIARQRASFLSSPLINAIITIWRATTRRVPHAEQKAVQDQIRALRQAADSRP